MPVLSGGFMRSGLFCILLMISSSLFSQESWTGITVCGLYSAKGIVRSYKDGLVINVNEKTKSEIIISVPIMNEPKLAPYLNKAVEASIEFKKLTPHLKLLGTVTQIKSRLPNPIDPSDTGIKLISKGACQ